MIWKIRKHPFLAALALSASIHCGALCYDMISKLFSGDTSGLHNALQVQIVDVPGEPVDSARIAKLPAELSQHKNLVRSSSCAKHAPVKYCNRKLQYAEMLEKGTGLFPALEYFDIPIPRSFLDGIEGMAYIGSYGSNTKNSGYELETLSMNSEKRLELLNKWLALPKTEQLSKIDQLIDTYDPDSGDLHSLVEEFYSLNFRREVYSEGGEDLRFIILNVFEEQLDENEFFRHAYDYLKKDPDSKLAVELLFALEESYYHQQVHIGVHNIELPQTMNTSLESEIIKRIDDILSDKIAEKYGSEQTLNDEFIKKRVEILERIVEIGNYRKNDALTFLAGLYSEMQDYKSAEKYARMINQNPDMHADGSLMKYGGISEKIEKIPERSFIDLMFSLRIRPVMAREYRLTHLLWHDNRNLEVIFLFN